ncbi:MAG: hypothetical protein KAR06_05870 [Deltaproteobacteria bacterium]|nr:hypothetical protein [Deltaproteobacteria bacterium]
MDEQNKFLTEAMGFCYHVWELKENFIDGHECIHCKKYWPMMPATQIDGINFSTWVGFGKLWNWAIEQNWWDEFIMRPFSQAHIIENLINPERFANAVYEFLKE